MAGLWCPSLGYGEERLVEAAAEQMRKLPFYHTFTQKVADVTIDLAEKLVAHGAGADVEGVLHQLRLGGQRHRRQDGLVLQQRARPAAEEEDHRPHQGLSRRHRGGGEPDRPARSSTAISTCRSPTSCTPTARTTTASASRARARSSSPRRMADELEALIQSRRAGHGRRLHRRAGDGRRRRDHAAARPISRRSRRCCGSTTCCSSPTR